MRVLSCVAATLAALVPASAELTAPPPRPKALPTPREMAAAREDVWGEAAIRAPGGPSYEFFRDLLRRSATSTPRSGATPSFFPRRWPR